MAQCAAAVEQVHSKEYVALFAGIAKTKIGKHSSAKRIVVVTDRNIQFFAAKSSAFEMAFSYLSLSTIAQHKSLHLTFAGVVISIRSEQMAQILATVKIAVAQFLTPVELRQCDLEKPAEQSGYYIWSRILEYQAIRELRLDPKYMTALKLAVLYRQEFVHLPLSDPNVTEVFLNVLPLCTFVKSVIFPPFPFSESHIGLLAQSTFLQSVAFTQQIPACLETWLQTKCTCSACSFSQCNLSEIFLKSLQNRSYPSLGFQNTISRAALPYFMNEFFVGPALQILNLDYSPDIDFRIVMSHISSVTVLSLAHCKLDVGDVFRLFLNTPFPNLRILNLTGSICMRPLDKNLSPPPNLFSLIVDKVDWRDGCILAFFVWVFRNFPNGVRLSVSNITAADSERDTLFALFGAVHSTPLVGLTWNKNPVDPGFFDLLHSSPHLEHLSLCQCFSEAKREPILRFTSYLQSRPRLHTLRISGHKSACLGALFGTVIDALEGVTTLQFLDVSGSFSGDTGLRSLITLLPSLPSLLLLDFEGMHLTSGAKLPELAQAIRDIPRLRASYPAEDITELADRGVDVGVFKSRFAISSPADPGARPFHVFKICEQPPVPEFLSNEDMSLLRGDSLDCPIQKRSLIPPSLSVIPPMMEVFEQSPGAFLRASESSPNSYDDLPPTAPAAPVRPPPRPWAVPAPAPVPRSPPIPRKGAEDEHSSSEIELLSSSDESPPAAPLRDDSSGSKGRPPRRRGQGVLGRRTGGRSSDSSGGGRSRRSDATPPESPIWEMPELREFTFDEGRWLEKAAGLGLHDLFVGLDSDGPEEP
jgi:hypothetical protein